MDPEDDVKTGEVESTSIAESRGSNKTARRWVWTNFITRDGELTKPTWNLEKMTYMVYQEEKCPNTGKNHLQGFTIFRQPVRRTTVQKLLGYDKQLHCEDAKGSNDQCYQYCTKEDTRQSPPVEYGIRPTGTGDRTDLKRYYNELVEGNSEGKLAANHYAIFAKYPNLYTRSKRALHLEEKRSVTLKPYVEVYWGPTGTGKSKTATEKLLAMEGAEKQFYTLTDNGNISGATLWAEYKGQKHVLIDEFYAWAKWHEILKWLDRGQVQVRIHGGMVPLLAEHIIITSNLNPRQWYNKLFESGKHDHVTWLTLKRRIDKIWHFGQLGQEPTETEE
jgi:hypothetical protein